jgi:hypothetical protein
MSYSGPPSGVSGLSFDKYIESQSYSDASALEKFQHQFYVAKEVVTRKLNKNRNDKDVTATDQELDTKLELFRSIQTSSADLHKTVVIYQQRVCQLAQCLNSLGRFLKETGKTEKAFTGKVMVSVGKVMSFSAYYVLAVKDPIDRLQQEVETFRLRAIHDSLRTVKMTEKNRQEYRGMLIWMKEVSEELNPDAYKQLEKFRKVQHQVRASKQKFDKDKVDCMQKIDLLAASRCNMFSHALQVYQENLSRFWQKSDGACETALQAIEERNFKKRRDKTEVGNDVRGTESSISLDLEASVSETALGGPDGDNLVELNEIPEGPMSDDLLCVVDDALKDGNEEMDELFRKFSESRLKEGPKKVSSLDSQFDAIFGFESKDTQSPTADQPGEKTKNELSSVFESADLLMSENPGEDAMGFLPSHLLDRGSSGDDWLSMGPTTPAEPTASSSNPGGDNSAGEKATKEKRNLTWMNAFAELDPLSEEAKLMSGEQA